LKKKGDCDQDDIHRPPSSLFLLIARARSNPYLLQPIASPRLFLSFQTFGLFIPFMDCMLAIFAE
jgi:hypothetical protein